ncbi:sulfite exporter TauE/SafE family protein [Mucilaginibacter litoreus]|uniref:Sulfite exporter TauE/SafE family protein n=1 Tax=Mucilaginibacter litoreus TaxID=1048221 RepID=A0ABW3AXH4_9SPHI
MLTGVNLTAFLMGLAGSVHCVGMCGPLAFGIPSSARYRWQLFADKLLYNIGRVATYTALGMLLGYAGKLFWLAGLQQTISIISGAIVFFAGLLRLWRPKSFRAGFSWIPLHKLIGFAVRHRAGHFILGMLNGLLPCGFVYIAMFGALTTAKPIEAGVFMFWFGAGTMPLMLAMSLSIGLLSQGTRRRINLTMPYLMLLLGVWFVLRGAGLNIPYLSPLIKDMGVSICH